MFRRITVIACGLLAPVAARAQAPEITLLTTSTTTRGQTETVTRPDAVVFSTRVFAGLGQAVLFDRTVAGRLGEAGPQASLGDGRQALITAAGPGVLILGPKLVASDSSTTGPRLVGTQTATSTTVTVEPAVSGPATIQIGPNRGTPFSFSRGTGVINTNINTLTITTSTFQATTTFSETYALSGQVRPLGHAHTAVQAGVLEAGERFLNRLGSEAETRGRVFGWAGGFGQWVRADPRAGRAGETRQASGGTAGIGYQVTEQLGLGFGVEQGRTQATVLGLGDTSGFEMTQVGPFARFALGPLTLSGAAAHGFGRASSTSLAELPGSGSQGDYGVRLFSSRLEGSWRFEIGQFFLSPRIGGDQVRAINTGFAENGPFALAIPRTSFDRARLWVGAELRRDYELPVGELLLRASARFIGVVAGRGTELPASFAFAPGSGTTLRGVPLGGAGAEINGRAVWRYTRFLQAYAAYDGRFADRYQGHTVTGGFRAAW